MSDYFINVWQVEQDKLIHHKCIFMTKGKMMEGKVKTCNIFFVNLSDLVNSKSVNFVKYNLIVCM